MVKPNEKLVFNQPKLYFPFFYSKDNLLRHSRERTSTFNHQLGDT
jgi:hypothetical protein